MVQIAGRYKLKKNENLGVYLKHLGASDELVQKAEKPDVTSEVTIDGDKYTFISSSGISIVFTLNKEFDEPMPIQGVTLKSIAKKESDNKIVLSSKAADGRSGVRTYEFSDEGYTLTLTSGEVTAKRHFVRI